MGPQTCQAVQKQKREDFGKVDNVQKPGENNVHSNAESFEDANPDCNIVGRGSYLRDTDMTIMSNLRISEKNHHFPNEFEQKEKHDSSPTPLPKGPMSCPQKKLLILDINGLLADVVSPLPKGHKADTTIARRAIFNRPYYLDFIEFCLEKFEVAIWSSRNKRNVELVILHLIGDMKHKLLFCWDASYCTRSKFKTLENRYKPLVFKDLRKVWESDDLNQICEGNIYNETNTLLVDDSPYKALFNPPHTAIFPYSFRYYDKDDNLLGPGGAIRVYIEKVAAAENVQKYVEQNPFGQRAITESSHDWDFYCSAINSVTG